MIGVNRETREPRLARAHRQAVEFKRDGGVLAGHVVVVIMPEKDAKFFPVEARERGNVRLSSHAVFQNRRERRCRGGARPLMFTDTGDNEDDDDEE